MPNEQLLAHIRGELAHGVDKTILIQSLLTAGWKVEDINAAMAIIPGTAPMPSQSPIPIKYAGFWMRVAANLIDGILLGLFSFVIRLAIPTAYANGVATIVGWIFIVFMVTKYQASPGKMAVGLHIQRTTNERVGVWRVIMREIVGKILSAIILGIGYLMVAWTKKKQGLHDMVADTVVVENDPNKSKTIWVVIGIFFGSLIPIAIVGILFSVVLASLNSAREKGNDAVVRSNMSSTLVQGEIYYGEIGNGSYLGYCNSPEALTALSAASSAGTADKNATSYICNDNNTAWAASAPLRTTASYECVASTGAMTEIVSPLASGQTSCGSPVQ